MELWIAALSLGLLSGFHCVGMCGPIALALPIGGSSAFMKIISILSYNFGRIATYSILGFIFGTIGESFAFFGFQQKLSVAAGIFILIFTIFPFLRKRLPSYSFPYLAKVRSNILTRFKKSDLRSLFIIGILNGLLPCGMVYVALAGAVASGSLTKSITFMALFGAATIPFMFSISYLGQLISMNTRNFIKRSQPYVMAIVAVLLILRGLDLGISNISPKLNEQISVDDVCTKNIECCHKK